MTKNPKKNPSWRDIKPALTSLDQAALLTLVHDLYRASQENQIFLHTRFSVEGDHLEPYKSTIQRWICPDVKRNQDMSIATAKKAIANYKKAKGYPEGIADLAVFYVECCVSFLAFCYVDDDNYYTALLNVLEQGLKSIVQLEPSNQKPFLSRIVKLIEYRNSGWFAQIEEELFELLDEHGFPQD